ncbi:MAG TPA: DUF6069 family protein [Ktedonobacterales bacterium]|nr:DUF6069 family protein [Ktedonobacterales bacterium]
MSATHTSSGALKRQWFSSRFLWVGALTILAAVVMNTLITLVAHAVFTVAPTFVPLQFTSVIPATGVAVTGAILVFALINRWSLQPVRLFRRIALGVLLVSIIPGLLLPFIGLFPGTTLPEVGALLLMHLATALLCINLAPRLLDTRA